MMYQTSALRFDFIALLWLIRLFTSIFKCAAHLPQVLCVK